MPTRDLLESLPRQRGYRGLPNQVGTVVETFLLKEVSDHRRPYELSTPPRRDVFRHNPPDVRQDMHPRDVSRHRRPYELRTHPPRDVSRHKPSDVCQDTHARDG